jgi:hypothetical protein
MSCAILATRGQPVRALDSAMVAQLAGEYRIHVVATTTGYPVPVRGGVLHVTHTPAPELWYTPALNPARRHRQPLTAAIRWDDGVPEGPVPGPLRLRDRVFVAVTDGGCYDCWHRSYRIAWSGSDSFGGTWYGDFGSVRLQGTGGQLLDRVEGEYCAQRIREESSSPSDT